MVMMMKTPAMNIRLCERKSIGRNEILNIISMNECHLYIYIFTEYKISLAVGWRKKQPIASVSDVDVLRKVL